MMGARGQATPKEAVLYYTESTKTDARMTLHDIWGSEAHVLMLMRQGILSEADARVILRHLEETRADVEAGRFVLDPQLEDVHMNVESRLIQAAGREYGGKLHTARSRNDQVLVDARLVVREEILRTEEQTVALLLAFLDLADEHAETILPGYTHTQHAQPITLGFWATGYATLLAEDLRRLEHAYTTVNRNPLGACALAGTTFPIDRHLTTRLLGFEEIEEHALAVVSGRDFVLETLFALTLLMTNLSRLAAEIISWNTYEFRLMTLDDAYALGSSIMPQKKNPDIAELARGRTAKVLSRLVEVFVLLKGLPLGYHRDLQEDKPPLWESFDTVRSTLALLKDVITTSRFHPERMLELTYVNFSTATELANWFVSERGLSFREAHELVGSLVTFLTHKGKTFRDVETCIHFLETHGYALTVEVLEEILDPRKSVWRNRSLGGTSPSEVRRMSCALRESVAAHLKNIQRRQNIIEMARKETARIVASLLRGESSATLLVHDNTEE